MRGENVISVRVFDSEGDELQVMETEIEDSGDPSTGKIIVYYSLEDL